MKQPGVGLILVVVFILSTFDAYAVDLDIFVPAGTGDVQLLSPGTTAVLSHLKVELKSRLDALTRRHALVKLKLESDSARHLYRIRSNEYESEVNSIKSHYMTKLVIRVTDARAIIAPDASTMGEIYFRYRAKNTSDRVIASITYRPTIGSIVVPTPTPLVLEFLDPATLEFGLAPGKDMADTSSQPEKFSFFVGELTAKDVDFVRRNISKEFRLDVVDIRFADRVGYKDQTRIMDVRRAFASRLRPLLEKVHNARAVAMEKEAMYKNALVAYNREKTDLLKRFAASVTSLKKSALRYRCKQKDKGRYTARGVEPGQYVIYSKRPNDMAVFYTIEVRGKAQTIKIPSIRKDPFIP